MPWRKRQKRKRKRRKRLVSPMLLPNHKEDVNLRSVENRGKRRVYSVLGAVTCFWRGDFYSFKASNVILRLFLCLKCSSRAVSRHFLVIPFNSHVSIFSSIGFQSPPAAAVDPRLIPLCSQITISNIQLLCVSFYKPRRSDPLWCGGVCPRSCRGWVLQGPIRAVAAAGSPESQIKA